MIWAFFILDAHVSNAIIFECSYHNVGRKCCGSENGPVRENIVIHLFDYVFNCCLHQKMW